MSFNFMLRYFLILFLICSESFQANLFSQIKPEILPEDFVRNETNITCYCKPGVRNNSRSKGLAISYGFLGSGTFEEEGTQF